MRLIPIFALALGSSVCCATASTETVAPGRPAPYGFELAQIVIDPFGVGQHRRWEDREDWRRHEERERWRHHYFRWHRHHDDDDED